MKFQKIRSWAAFVLTAVLLLQMFPVKVSAEEPTVVDPEITSASVSPSTVQKGNSFEANIRFHHDDSTINNAGSAIVKVSSPNGAIRIKKNEFTITDFSETDAETAGGKYFSLYMPENYLTYSGPGPGVLQFAITYYTSKDASKGTEIATKNRIVIRKTLIAGEGSADNTVRVDESSSTPTIVSGTSATVAIPLISGNTLEDAQIEVAAPTDTKIMLTSAGAVYTMSFVSGEKKYLNLPLRVDSSVAAGIYPITLTINGNKVTAYLQVLDSAQGKGGVRIDSYKLDRSNIYSGSTFRMDLVLKNTGSQTYHNISAALDGLATDSLTVVGSLDRKSVTSLAPGATATVSFNMQAASKMETGNYAVGVNLTSDEVTEAVATKVFVSVVGTGDSTGGKPIIIIENYSFGGTSITGGKTFPLSLRFHNANTSTAIQNLKITISSTADEDTGGVFTPANSSNTFFISKLGAGASIDKSIELYPKADAKPKSYGIDVKFEYESAADTKHEQITSTETISIPLTQPDRFEVTNAEVQGPIQMGTDGQLAISYVNKGKSTVYNLSVLLEGNFTAPETNIYIGNVESGSSDSYDTNLTPAEEGTLQGKATITYEDPNGKTQTIVKEFSCEVQPAQPVDQGEMDGESSEPLPGQSSGIPVWGWLLGLALIAGGVAAAVLVRRKRAAKKKALLELEEDYDDIQPQVSEPEEEQHQNEDRS
ncbi:COG1361 S-layer family protein [Faecalispora anaeroviscerum]|uniref:COG1361 S-layer family protein n=1 Tax=Faecalispora anaeroviscerum TaxID=2991836 RepID=UPI0024BACBCD|nr:cell adhesion protein [Faecalispora anaeroviscerum]